MLNLFSSHLTSRGSLLNRALIQTKDISLRRFKLHEYQGAKLLNKYKVPITHGNVAFDGKEAFLVAKQFGESKPVEYVVKAQVHSGGRGKGNFREDTKQRGVQLVKTAEDVKRVADNMIGKHLITNQSGPDGILCKCVYIVERVDIDKEFYLSLTLDRKAGGPTFIYSREGGMDIEEVARSAPEKIFKLTVNILKGLDIEDLLQAAKNLGLEEHKTQVVFMFKHIYDCFIERDCDLIEINPLALLKNG
jgi:succinyl-CoA synthetase beta subunit